MTKDLKLCKCGIAEVDCDYHKPKVPVDNPFTRNNFTDRAIFMKENPLTWEIAMKDADLIYPWSQAKSL